MRGLERCPQSKRKLSNPNTFLRLILQAIKEELGSAVAEFVEIGNPELADLLKALSGFDSVERRFVPKQAVELIDFELTRIKPVKCLGDPNAQFEDRTRIAVREND